jgi:hypothetical protein
MTGELRFVRNLKAGADHARGAKVGVAADDGSRSNDWRAHLRASFHLGPRKGYRIVNHGIGSNGAALVDHRGRDGRTGTYVGERVYL